MRTQDAGGYTGFVAARALARQSAAVVVLEAETLGFGGSIRSGGIVHWLDRAWPGRSREVAP